MLITTHHVKPDPIDTADRNHRRARIIGQKVGKGANSQTD